jgi:hypothetical protein
VENLIFEEESAIYAYIRAPGSSIFDQYLQPFPRSTFELISNSMKNLKHLELPMMTTFVHLMTFENLESLNFTKISSKSEHITWISLALCCPKLKKVQANCGTFDFPSKELKELLTTGENLQELYIENYEPNDEFFEIILGSESKSFNLIKINQMEPSRLDEITEKFNGTKIRFVFVHKMRKVEE